MKKNRLLLVACVASVLTLGANTGFAGEIAGNGKSVQGREKSLENQEAECRQLEDEDKHRLERAAGMSRDEARRQLRQLDELGLDLGMITDQLQAEGVDAFARSFDSLMEGITQKRKRKNSK